MANTVVLTFDGDAKNLSKTFDKVDGDSRRLGSSLGDAAKKAAKGAAILGGVGVAAMGAFGLSAISAGEALNSIRSQTGAVVESTKGIANVSASHVKEYAQELSNLAAVDRKVIESGQNVLLTFTNVRNEMGAGNDIFDQGTLAALNMSAALGQDMQSSITMVGKALNDPIQGITAMSDAGIQFTEQQKEQIKVLTESGDILGAQKIILGELETQFAGSAAANADTSDKLKLAFQRITEEVGLKLLPYLDKFADWVLGTGIPAAEKLAGVIGPVLARAFGLIGDIIGKAMPYVRLFVESLTTLKASFQTGENFGGGGIFDVMGKIGTTAHEVWGILQTFIGKFREFWSALTTGFSQDEGTGIERFAFRVRDVLSSLVQFWQSHRDQIMAILNQVVSIIGSAFSLISITIQRVVQVIQFIWGHFGDEIMTVATIAFNLVVGVIRGALDIIQGIIRTVTAVMRGDWSAAWEGIKQILSGVLTIIKALISAAFASIKATIQVAWALVRTLTSSAWATIRSIIGAAINAAKSLVSSAINAIVGFFTGLPGRAAKALAGLASAVTKPFKDAYDGAKKWLGKIPGLGGGMPSISVPKLNFPKFHDGGTYRAPFGKNEGAAWLKDGETVMTRQQMNSTLGAAAASGGGGSNVLVVDFRGGSSPVQRAYVEMMRQAVKTGGGLDVVFSG